MLEIQVKPHKRYLSSVSNLPQKLFVLFKFIPHPEVLSQRSNVAIGLVVDTSASMREELGAGGIKIDKAIEASHKIIEHPALTENDLFTLVHFNTRSDVILPLAPISNKQKIHDSIEKLRDYNGGTMMHLGMNNALKELKKAPPQTVKKMILLTDGFTSREDSTRKSARTIADYNIPITTIGIGDEYNEDLLIYISEVTRGMPYHLEDMNILQDILQEQVENVTEEVITNVKVQFKVVKDVKIVSFYKIFPNVLNISIDKDVVNLGNFRKNDETIFLLELDLPPRSPSIVRVLKADFRYDVPGVNIYGDEKSVDVVVEYTTDEVLVNQIDNEVLNFVKQRNIAHIVDKAAEYAKTSPEKALETIQMAKNITQRLGNATLLNTIQLFEKELKEKGTVSAGTLKTIKVNSRTQTIKADAISQKIDEDTIRKMTGT